MFNTMKSQEKIHKSELSGHRFGPQAQNRGMAPAEARPLTKPMSNRAARVSAWHLGRPPGQAPSPAGRSPASLSPVPFVRESAGWVNRERARFPISLADATCGPDNGPGCSVCRALRVDRVEFLTLLTRRVLSRGQI